ncbi:MAG: 4Fe-4S binding protein [Bacillota bacterium]|nr:4Fe-4S binding protein [Bacillota bacterium]
MFVNISLWNRKLPARIHLPSTFAAKENPRSDLEQSLHHSCASSRQHLFDLACQRTAASLLLHYRLLEHHAGECIACGKCEENCPFDVSIAEKMKQAAEVFGY